MSTMCVLLCCCKICMAATRFQHKLHRDVLFLHRDVLILRGDVLFLHRDVSILHGDVSIYHARLHR